MSNETINIIDFMKARGKEIEAIEASIENSKKKSMLFQRVPFYKRRRNRNYDKRMNRKFTYRKRDRHFLRTHTFYSKRFFMLKLQYCSIPVTRRIKSSKYIYKSQHRGFIFDESFRKVYVYKKGIIYNLVHNTDLNDKFFTSEIQNILKNLDFNKNDKIQYFNNEFEIIVQGHSLFSIGKRLIEEHQNVSYCCISVMKKDIPKECDLSDFESVKIAVSEEKGLETCKILCKRSEIMNIFQKMIVNGFIPICLDEINRLALENSLMSIYDNVKSEIFEEIEAARNEEIIGKYNRTPSSKKQKYGTSGLYLSHRLVWKYFMFKILKGRSMPGAEIYNDEKCVGHVIRSEFKYSSAYNYGLGFFTSEISFEDCGLYCKNLGQSNFYEIEIEKVF